MGLKYHAFMLRLWTSEINGDSTWHISMESAESGEKKIFANIDDLYCFLKDLLGISSVLEGDNKRQPE